MIRLCPGSSHIPFRASELFQPIALLFQSLQKQFTVRFARNVVPQSGPNFSPVPPDRPFLQVATQPVRNPKDEMISSAGKIEHVLIDALIGKIAVLAIDEPFPQDSPLRFSNAVKIRSASLPSASLTPGLVFRNGIYPTDPSPETLISSHVFHYSLSRAPSKRKLPCP